MIDKRGQEQPCPFCDRVFKQKGRLDDHVKKKHAAELQAREEEEAARKAKEAAKGDKLFDVGSGKGFYDKKSPKMMLMEWCRKHKRPNPRYTVQNLDGGRFGCKVVLKDPKHADQDVVVFLDKEKAVRSKEEAQQLGALAGLHRVQGDRALHLTLPKQFVPVWNDFGRVAEERAQRQERAAAKREERERKQEKRKKAQQLRKPQELFLSGEKQRLVEGILSEARGGGGPANEAAAAAAAEPLTVEDRDLVLELASMNFREEDAERAVRGVRAAATGAPALPDALDWLCLHLDPSLLPSRFAQGSSRHVVGVLNTKKDPDAEAVAALVQYGYGFAESKAALGAAGKDFRAALGALWEGACAGLARAEPAEADGGEEEGEDAWEDEWTVFEAIYDAEATRKSGGGIAVALAVPYERGGAAKEARVAAAFWPPAPAAGRYPLAAPVVALAAPDLAALDILHLTRLVSAEAFQMLGTPMLHDLVGKVEELAAQALAGEFRAPAPAPAPAPGRGGRPTPAKPRRTHRGHGALSPQQAAALGQQLRREHEQLKSAGGALGQLQKQRRALPAASKRAEVLAAVAGHQVVVISGATGCGKSTQVPQYVLEQEVERGRGGECYIVCTQPRRISAVGLASRVSAERGEDVGQSVGYSIRLESKQSAKTRLLFCTTGILLRRLIGDPALRGVTHVVVDEVHERSLDSDLLLLLLSQLLQRSAALRVVLMSATADAGLFSDYFTGHMRAAHIERPLALADIVSIPGFTHPVEERYLEDVFEATGYRVSRGSKYAKRAKADDRKKDKRRDGGPGEEAAAGADPLEAVRAWAGGYSRQTQESLAFVDEAQINYELIERLVVHIMEGDPDPQPGASAILVFLPGTGEIGKLKRQLEGNPTVRAHRPMILPLHGALPAKEQARVFGRPPRGCRKVVLSTNVAETSVTIDDVTVVIDTGRMKEMGYDPQRGLSCLQETWVSQAAAKQRRGRAGRVQPGVCWRVYSSRRFAEDLEEYQSPEVLRVPLDALCLQVKAIIPSALAPTLRKLISPPQARAVDKALLDLRQVQALDEAEALTPLGRHLVQMPVDARVGKMLIFGALLRCLNPVLTIAAAMSGRSPFLSPADKRAEANAARDRLAAHAHKSDHLAIVAAFNGWQAARERGGPGAGRAFCEEHFLSGQTIESIAKLRADFAGILADLGFVGRDYLHQLRRVGAHKAVQESADRADLDDQAHNGRIIKAVICAAFYPSLLRVAHPTQKYKETEGGTMEKDAEAHTVKIFAREQGRVFIHPRSVNFSVGKYESGWLVYTSMVETSKVYVTESSMVPAYAVLLFGGKLRVDHDRGRIVVDDWAEFQAPGKIAVLICELQAEVDRVLEAKVGDPGLEVQRSPVVEALLAILGSDGF